MSYGLLTGCKTVPQQDPLAVYQEIHEDLIHGDLKLASTKVDTAQAEFSSDPSWRMKFRLLQAEVFLYEGLAPPVVKLLACDAVAFPAATDLIIKRDILCAQEQALIGKLPVSDRQIDEARELCISTHSPLLGELLRTEALIADEYKNDQEASIKLYNRSLETARMSNDVFLEAGDLLNLGMVALDREHFDEALDFFAQSSTLAEKIHALQISQAGLGNSGMAYLDLGDSFRALSNFKQAEKEAIESGVVNDQVAWLWDEGISYYRLNNPAEAEICYRRSLELARSIDDYDALAGLNTELGFLLYEKGQYPLALSLSKNALTAAESSHNRDSAIKPLFLQALTTAHLTDPDAAETQLLDVQAKSASNSDVRSAIEAALGIFYNRASQPKKADVWYRKAILTFEASRDTVKAEELRLPFFTNGEAIYRDYANFLIDTHQPGKALDLFDQGRARTLSEGLGQLPKRSRGQVITPLRPQQTAKKLNATILFYALGPDKSYLWAINSKQTKLFILPKASELQSAIQSYSKSLLKSSDPLRESDRNATFLYNSVVGPATAMIPPHERVIIIPDGALNQLNFETLIVPGMNSPHYWIEDVTVTNASSIRMLTRGASGSNSVVGENLLLIGNPVTSSTGFEPLPHASSEMLSIEKRFPQNARTVIAQSAAVPSSYSASRPEQFGYIHFVAHGTASVLSPLDSAVILSPTQQHPEVFKLYARDIIHHPIHAQLVTISACNGAGMRAYAGEGLVGLSWAFLRAGAHNVIGALWQVDDAATPLIMDRLYDDLRVHHSTPDSALRNAKLQLIHSTGVYRKPLYWGAFQLYTGS